MFWLTFNVLHRSHQRNEDSSQNVLDYLKIFFFFGRPGWRSQLGRNFLSHVFFLSSMSFFFLRYLNKDIRHGLGRNCHGSNNCWFLGQVSQLTMRMPWIIYQIKIHAEMIWCKHSFNALPKKKNLRFSSYKNELQ